MNNKESIFSRLEKDLNNGGNHEKIFPEFFNPESKKVKILFVAPRMDAYGYYQQILPALYFNRKDSKYTTSCITVIAKSKQELDCTIDEAVVISNKMIELANIIVFPFTEQDLTPAYRAIRAINTNAKICYTVDYDFYNVPKSHNKYNLLKDESTIGAIEGNIFYSDKVFVPKQSFIPYMADKLHNKYPERKNIFVDVIPFYISGKNYEHIDMSKIHKKRIKEGVIRIGIISYWHTVDDFMEIKEWMEWLVKKFPKKFEFCIWGVDFTLVKKKKLGRKPKVAPKAVRIPKTVEPTNSFLYYYKNLYELDIDCIITHRAKNDWNKNNREPHEIMDAAFYRIPTITNINSEYLSDNTIVNYSDMEELKNIFINMAQTDAPFKHIGQAAREYIIQQYGIDAEGVRGGKIESVYLSFESLNVLNDANDKENNNKSE
jgi:hypothetical protein